MALTRAPEARIAPCGVASLSLHGTPFAHLDL